LLGGTAFAVTFFVMTGVPAPLQQLYHHAAAGLAGKRTTAPAHDSRPRGAFGALWQRPGERGEQSGVAAGHERAHSMPTTSGSQAASPSGPSSGSVRGAPLGPQAAQVRVVSSWSAYLYAADVATRGNRNNVPYVDVSVRDSEVWPGPVCGGGALAPPAAYAFEPVASMSDGPCPPDASGQPSRVVAIRIGSEAVALARSPLYGALDLTRREVFLALAKWVPDPARPGAVRANANTTWRQIDPAAGPEPIEFLGPPLSSAAGRSMIELLLEGGCNSYPWIAALRSSDPDRYARICRTVRTDAVYTEVAWLNPSRVLSNPNAIGIVAFQTLVDARLDEKLAVSRLDGVEPTLQSIESGSHPGSRGFYIYINRGRMAPNVALRLLAFGLLAYPPPALVPLSESERRAAVSEVFDY
jgi:hypothetical protein